MGLILEIVRQHGKLHNSALSDGHRKERLWLDGYKRISPPPQEFLPKMIRNLDGSYE
jgi:hypothetical protein